MAFPSPYGSTLPPVFHPRLLGLDSDPPAVTESDPLQASEAANQQSLSSVSSPAATKPKRGRRKDPAWDEVIVADDIVSCKKCEKIIHQMGATHVERVRDHLMKKCTKRAKTRPITACFPVALAPPAILAFQMQFAFWFYSTGMAFNKVAHPSLKKALLMLYPQNLIPTRIQLATTLLAACYRDMKLRMTHVLGDRICTLTTDAWTDVNGKAVINYVLLCGEDTYFLESVYTGSDSHDASFLAKDIKRVIEKVNFATIAAVVTDNTATNKLVWRYLQTDYPQMFFHGCVSHVIHLAVKDLVSRLKWLQTLETNCRKRVKFFKKNQQMWFELRHLQKMQGKNALVMPVDTRWGTIESCFVSILESEGILHALVSGRNFLKARTKDQKAKRRMVHDVVKARDFVQQLEKAIRILSVLSKFQKVFERNSTPISDVYKMFLQLPRIFEDQNVLLSELGIITKVIKERFDFVYGDAHGVAYLLDPRYGGENMDDNTRDNVLEFISSWHGTECEDAATIELVQYLAMVQKQPREIKLVKQKRIGVYEFWCGVQKYPLFKKVALVVFSSASSSAAAERNFSAHKFIHSLVRNRLQEANVEKLVFIFFNSKNMDADEIAEFDMLEDLAADSSEEDNNNQDSDFEYY